MVLDEFNTTIIISVSIGILVLGISLVIQYFIMKAAVRNGTIEAQGILQNRSVEKKTEKEIWLCPECKTENPNDVYVCKKCEYSLR